MVHSETNPFNKHASLHYNQLFAASAASVQHLTLEHNGSRLCAVATRAHSTGEGHYSSRGTSRVTDALSLDTKTAILKPGCVTGRDSWYSDDGKKLPLSGGP